MHKWVINKYYFTHEIYKDKCHRFSKPIEGLQKELEEKMDIVKYLEDFCWTKDFYLRVTYD